MSPKIKKISPLLRGKERIAGDRLRAVISRLTDGLVYISETDAEVVPYDGEPIDADASQEYEKETFFDRLTRGSDWHGPRERARAKRYRMLRDLLEHNLTDLRVIKTPGTRRQIFVVGRDAEGRLAGIRTEAVET